MRRSLHVACVLLFAACDPGASFIVPGATVVMDNGREFELAGPSQTALRVHANAFTSTLSTSMRITNIGTSPLTVRPKLLRALNQDGEAIARKQATAPTCGDHEREEEVVLPPGATCSLHGSFEVIPRPYHLDTLTLIHDGVSRAGVLVPISVTFERD